MSPFTLTVGTSPVILAMPHSGTFVPPEITDKLNVTGKKLADTDWHIPRLYDGLLPSASIIQANFHRYVIDANRSPDNAHLYPGQNTTSLCPLTDFEGKALYNEGQEPDAEEITLRLVQFHTPYHTALQEIIERTKAQHGFAILYDCHSIRSEVPFLFKGTLPTLNIGTNDGKSCNLEIANTVAKICANSAFSSVLNGRFKGGWTTRHYGNPAENAHAIQMEITQNAYMNEATPWDYLPERAERLREPLRELLTQLSHLKL